MLLERAYEKFRKQPSYQRIAGTMAVSIGLLGSGGPAFAQNYNPFNYEQLNCRSVREMYIDALQKKRPSWAYSLPPQRREKIALDMEDAFLGRKKSSVIMDRIGKVLDMFDPKRKENPMKRECGWYMMKLLIYFGKAGRATEILLQDINSPRRESGTVKLLGDLREKRALPTLMRLLETENTGQLEDTFYAIRRIAERMRAENPDPEYKAWSRSVMEKMFQAITKRGYYEDPFGNNAFEAVRDFSLIANASNYAALAMKELLTERSYSWLPESRFVYLVILGGNSGQKRQLLRFLAGSWRRSGTLESREIAGYLYVLAKNGDRKLQTDVAAMFYSTVIGGVADCLKRDVSLHRLQDMAERISSRFREDWNKAIKSRAGCFRI